MATNLLKMFALDLFNILMGPERELIFLSRFQIFSSTVLRLSIKKDCEEVWRRFSKASPKIA